jgi:predicted DNA binding CopG/RHH family protein
MLSNYQDPFNDAILDDEEQSIEDAIDRGEYRDVPDLESSKKLIEEAASRYVQLNTTKPITLRVKQTDLIKIKAKAKRSNIPYQTLLSALLHDFAEGEKELTIK